MWAIWLVWKRIRFNWKLRLFIPDRTILRDLWSTSPRGLHLFTTLRKVSDNHFFQPSVYFTFSCLLSLGFLYKVNTYLLSCVLRLVFDHCLEFSVGPASTLIWGKSFPLHTWGLAHLTSWRNLAKASPLHLGIRCTIPQGQRQLTDLLVSFWGIFRQPHLRCNLVWRLTPFLRRLQTFIHLLSR